MEEEKMNAEIQNDVEAVNEEPILKKSFKKKLEKKDEEIEKLKFDVEHWKNEYYKAYADMANLRKDIQKDQQNIIKYRIEGFVDKLLGVLDSFDMAFKIKPSNEETSKYLIGFEYVHQNLLRVLEEEGIEVINPALDSKYDEKTMHAVELKQDDGEENLIKEVYLKGYKLHDHLIRPANVVVSAREVKDENKENNK